jgi:hypothetical protein
MRIVTDKVDDGTYTYGIHLNKEPGYKWYFILAFYKYCAIVVFGRGDDYDYI